MATLTGKLYGSNRDAMLKEANTKAVTYFATGCVKVELSNETAHPMTTGFTADFTAKVWHDLEYREYGPDKCRKCGAASWPQNPLNKEER